MYVKTKTMLMWIPFWWLGCEGVHSDFDKKRYDEQLEAFCKRLIECEKPFLGGSLGTLSDCKKVFGGMVKNDGCWERLATDECEVLGKAAIGDECIVLCEEDSRRCIDHQIHFCQNHSLFVFDCNIVCRYATGTAYTGACGIFHPTAPIQTEVDTCFCE